MELAMQWVFGLITILALGVASCADAGSAPSELEQQPPNPNAPGVASAAIDGCDAIDLPPPKAGEGVQLELELPLGPGEERQVCQLVKLGAAVNLNWAEGMYTRGSHHGLTARTTYRGSLPSQNIRGEMVDASQLATCENITSDWEVLGVIADGHPAGGTPRRSVTDKGALPEDVALKLGADEILVMNFHILNATDAPMRACYKQNLHGIPDARVKQEASMMFYFNSFITLPAHASGSATMACPVSHDVTLGSQVSHMHGRGLGYTATLLDADPLEGGRELEVLYEGTTWEEPVARFNDPALALRQGQWIRWSCQYQNTSDLDIAQGQETSDEMCMFLGMYWPRSDAMDFCKTPGSSDWYSAARLLSDGKMTGAQFLDCWKQSPRILGGGGPASAADRYASQRCFTESCAKVSGRVAEFGAGTLDPATVTCD